MPIIIPYMGKMPKISDKAFIAESACIIGDVVIEDYASIWYNCVIRGDVNYIRIGHSTNIQDNTTVHVASEKDGMTIIGNNVTVGHNCIIHACNISNFSLIGMGTAVMDYATIMEYTIIAACSVVTRGKSIPSQEMWMGQPARPKRQISDEEKKYIEDSAEKYKILSRNYMSKG